jgi:hypothetical protein
MRKQSAMLRMCTTFFLVVFSSVISAPGAANLALNNPQVIVSVTNNAGVPVPELHRAELDAETILHSAGLHVSWENRLVHEAFAGSTYDNPGELFLRIIPGPIPSMGSSAFGISFLSSDGSGRYADIFYRRTLQLHKDWGGSLGDTLGAVIAHEIGHLLLGSNSHAPFGIMRAHWQGEELRMLARGALLFTPEQAARMQLRLRNRNPARKIMMGELGGNPTP